MKTAIAKRDIEAVLAPRFGHIFERREQLRETLPTGIGELDAWIFGFPRGAITEIHGAASSGRTSMLLSALAGATAQEETCALIDCSDTFDVASAAKAGVDFNQVLWVRCSNYLERAFKTADLLLHNGGFGMVALDLSDVSAKSARRIISSWWFRFRRAIENKPTALIVITPVACIRSCAALVIEMKIEAVLWSRVVSLVSKNGNGGFKEGRGDWSRHLSLVAAPSVRHSTLSHSQFIEGMRIGVNRERPVEWSGATVRFTVRSPKPRAD